MEIDKGLSKDLDEFESGVANEVADARKKIDSIGEQTREQYQNWKRVLSGALNDKQLIIALTVLFGFYLCFTGFNTILGGNSREENIITCACPVEHSAYYRTLLIVTIAVWIVCFILTTIWDSIKFWRYAIGKGKSRRHQPAYSPAKAESTASSILNRAIGPIEEGTQAARKVPMQSMLSKAMEIVDNTLDIADEGAKKLQKVNSELKEAKEKPLGTILEKSMEVADDTITRRLESTDENAASKSEVAKSNKPPSALNTLLKNATDIVNIAKQDPTLAKVVNPLDKQAQGIKQSSVGSMLAKSVELVEDGMQATNHKPAEFMVTEAMDFVDDKAQINSAELIAKSKEAVNEVKENPTNLLLAASTNMIGNTVTAANQNLERSNALQLAYAARQDCEVLDDGAMAYASSNVLSAAMGMASNGLQAVKQSPDELALSKTMEFAMDKADKGNTLVTNTVSLVASDTSNEDPANSLLQGTMEMTKQNPVVAEASLNDGSLAPSRPLLLTTLGMVDSKTPPMEQSPANSIFTKTVGFAEDDDPAKQMLAKSVSLVTNVLSSKSTLDSLANATELAQQNPEHEPPVSSSSMIAATRFVDTGMQQDPKFSKQNTLTSDVMQEPQSTQVPEIVCLPEQNPTEQIVDLLSTELQSKKQDCATQSAITTVATDGPTRAGKSITFGKSKIISSRSKKSLLGGRELSKADANALMHLKHYEDYLWLQFYKVYSVGATLEGEDQVLPAFINVVGGDHESNRFETSIIKPLLKEEKSKAHKYPETELVEMTNSCDEIDTDENPVIVIEPGDYHSTEQSLSTAVASTTFTEYHISDEALDAMNCYRNCNTEDYNISDSTDNIATTNHHHDETNEDSTTATLELSPDKHHSLAEAKSMQSTSSMLSVKSNFSADNEKDLMSSWIHLKPVGLYNESTDGEENMAMQVADATCARVSFFLYPLLVITRLVAQLVMVPLLLFQIIDTYTWICITDDIYCSSIVNQYRLGLDKAALTFTFHCCLLASILATAILRWFPCSKYARKAGATCIM